jgi:hypothetical protein
LDGPFISLSVRGKRFEWLEFVKRKQLKAHGQIAEKLLVLQPSLESNSFTPSSNCRFLDHTRAVRAVDVHEQQFGIAATKFR